jgi:hypothetical protein
LELTLYKILLLLLLFYNTKCARTCHVIWCFSMQVLSCMYYQKTWKIGEKFVLRKTLKKYISPDTLTRSRLCLRLQPIQTIYRKSFVLLVASQSCGHYIVCFFSLYILDFFLHNFSCFEFNFEPFKVRNISGEIFRIVTGSVRSAEDSTGSAELYIPAPYHVIRWIVWLQKLSVFVTQNGSLTKTNNRPLNTGLPLPIISSLTRI